MGLSALYPAVAGRNLHGGRRDLQPGRSPAVFRGYSPWGLARAMRRLSATPHQARFFPRRFLSIPQSLRVVRFMASGRRAPRWGRMGGEG